MSLVDYAQIAGTIVALGYFFYRLHKAETRADTLEKEMLQLREKAAQDDRANKEALRGATEYYRENIERHEGQIDGLKKMNHLHEKFIGMDTNFINLLMAKLEKYEK